MTLKHARTGQTHTVRAVMTEDEELRSFLFTLGCYEGEPITVIHRLWGSAIVALKDGRYNIDNRLAEAILV